MIRTVLERYEDPEILGAKSDNIQYISAMSDAVDMGRNRSNTGLIVWIWYQVRKNP